MVSLPRVALISIKSKRASGKRRRISIIMFPVWQVGHDSSLTTVTVKERALVKTHRAFFVMGSRHTALLPALLQTVTYPHSGNATHGPVRGALSQKKRSTG